MKLDVAAVLAAVTSMVVALAAAMRGLTGDRFQRQVTQGAKVLESYTGLVDDLEKRIERMQADHSVEISAMRTRYAEERLEWEGERSALRKEMGDLKQERVRLSTELHELRALVESMIFRDPLARTRTTDKDNSNRE